MVEHLVENVEKSVAIHNWISAAKLMQKMSMLGSLLRILDIIRVDNNVDDEYADTKRTSWLTNYIWEGEWSWRERGQRGIMTV